MQFFWLNKNKTQYIYNSVFKSVVQLPDDLRYRVGFCWKSVSLQAKGKSAKAPLSISTSDCFSETKTTQRLKRISNRPRDGLFSCLTGKISSNCYVECHHCLTFVTFYFKTLVFNESKISGRPSPAQKMLFADFLHDVFSFLEGVSVDVVSDVCFDKNYNL